MKNYYLFLITLLLVISCGQSTGGRRAIIASGNQNILPGEGCLSDDDCNENEICKNALCQAAEAGCKDSSECNEDQTCLDAMCVEDKFYKSGDATFAWTDGYNIYEPVSRDNVRYYLDPGQIGAVVRIVDDMLYCFRDITILDNIRNSLVTMSSSMTVSDDPNVLRSNLLSLAYYINQVLIMKEDMTENFCIFVTDEERSYTYNSDEFDNMIVSLRAIGKKVSKKVVDYYLARNTTEKLDLWGKRFVDISDFVDTMTSGENYTADAKNDLSYNLGNRMKEMLKSYVGEDILIDTDLGTFSRLFCPIAYKLNKSLEGYCFKDCRLYVTSFESIINEGVIAKIKVICNERKLNSTEFKNIRVKTNTNDITYIVESNDDSNYLKKILPGFDFDKVGSSSTYVDAQSSNNRIFIETEHHDNDATMFAFSNDIVALHNLTLTKEEEITLATKKTILKGDFNKYYINIDKKISIIKK